MSVPNYEVGRLAALTVRMVMASGLSRDDARQALDLACAMMDGEPAHAQNRRRMPLRASDSSTGASARGPNR